MKIKGPILDFLMPLYIYIYICIYIAVKVYEVSVKYIYMYVCMKIKVNVQNVAYKRMLENPFSTSVRVD